MYSNVSHVIINGFPLLVLWKTHFLFLKYIDLQHDVRSWLHNIVILPKSGITWSYDRLFLIFWVISILFSLVSAPIYSPPTMHEGFIFSLYCLTIVICCNFYNGHSDRYEMMSYCGFVMHSPDDWWWINWLYWPEKKNSKKERKEGKNSLAC